MAEERKAFTAKYTDPANANKDADGQVIGINNGQQFLASDALFADDVNKIISNQLYFEGKKAPKESPVFTGTPKAPTAASGTSTDQIATTKFVATGFAPLASPKFTGAPKINTQTIATEAYVDDKVSQLRGEGLLAGDSFIFVERTEKLKPNSSNHNRTINLKRIYSAIFIQAYEEKETTTGGESIDSYGGTNPTETYTEQIYLNNAVASVTHVNNLTYGTSSLQVDFAQAAYGKAVILSIIGIL